MAKCNKNTRRRGNAKTNTHTTPDVGEKMSNVDTSNRHIDDEFPRNRKRSGSTNGSNYPITTDNDVNWYARSKELLDQAARLNFSNRAGDPIAFTGKSVLTNTCDIVPGIMRFDYIPALGRTSITPKDSATYSYIANSVMKDAGTNIYSYVRSHNSGAINYEWQDMIAIIYAGSQIFSAIAHAIRIYGIAKTNYQNNTYMPDEILRSMAIDPAAFRKDLANYLFRLNYLIQKASVIWVPNDFPITQREYWMNTNLYYDADSTKAGIMYYFPAIFYKYSPKTSSSGSALVPTYSYAKANDDGTKLLDTIEQMLNAILDDSDAGTMFGDLYKTYGADKLYSVGEISPDYSLAPVYNEEVNQQFHGLTIVETANYPSILQDVERSEFVQDCFTVKKAFFTGSFTDLVFDLYGKEDLPERVMVATRMTSMVQSVTKGPGDDTYYLEVVSGSEICVGTHVYTRLKEGGLDDLTLFTFLYEGDQNTIKRITRADKFDWAPTMYVAKAKPDPTAGFEVVDIVGDLENYTHLGMQALEKMHTTAILSEFGVPVKIV